MTADDAMLVREFAETRSESAFAELVRRYADLVYATARRVTGSSAVAEDVAQEIRPLPDFTEWTERIANQVLTRAKSMIPTTPNMMLGSQAAKSAGIIPLPPMPLVS